MLGRLVNIQFMSSLDARISRPGDVRGILSPESARLAPTKPKLHPSGSIQGLYIDSLLLGSVWAL